MIAATETEKDSEQNISIPDATDPSHYEGLVTDKVLGFDETTENDVKSPTSESESKEPFGTEQNLSANLTNGDIEHADEFVSEFNYVGFSFTENNGRVDLEKDNVLVGPNVESFTDASGYYSAVSRAFNEGRGVWISKSDETQTIYAAVIVRQADGKVLWNTYERKIVEPNKDSDQEEKELDEEERLTEDAQTSTEANTEVDIHPIPDTEQAVTSEKSQMTFVDFFRSMHSEEDQSEQAVEENNSNAEESKEQVLQVSAPPIVEAIALELEIPNNTNEIDDDLNEDITVVPEITPSVTEVTTDSVQQTTIAEEEAVTEDQVQVIIEEPASPFQEVLTTPVEYTEVEAETSIATEKPTETAAEVVVESNTAETVEVQTPVPAPEEIVESVVVEEIPEIEIPDQTRTPEFIESQRQTQIGANEVFEHLLEQAQFSATIFSDSHQVESVQAKDLLAEVIDQQTPAEGLTQEVLGPAIQIEDLDNPFEITELSSGDEKNIDVQVASQGDRSTTTKNTSEQVRTPSLDIEESLNSSLISPTNETGPIPSDAAELNNDSSVDSITYIESEKPPVIVETVPEVTEVNVVEPTPDDSGPHIIESEPTIIDEVTAIPEVIEYIPEEPVANEKIQSHQEIEEPPTEERAFRDINEQSMRSTGISLATESEAEAVQFSQSVETGRLASQIRRGAASVQQTVAPIQDVSVVAQPKNVSNSISQ